MRAEADGGDLSLEGQRSTPPFQSRAGLTSLMLADQWHALAVDDSVQGTTTSATALMGDVN